MTNMTGEVLQRASLKFDRSGTPRRSQTILFVGTIPEGGTCRMRMEALLDLGHRVEPFSVLPYQTLGGPIIGRVLRRLVWGPGLKAINRQILEKADSLKPDIIFVDKGTWVSPETLIELRNKQDCRLVHYTHDAAFIFNKTRHFVRSVPHYDLMVTTKAYELDHYRRHGARDLLFQYSTFDPKRHGPVQLSSVELSRFQCDLVFVGTFARGREKYLGPLAKRNFDLAIWGQYWPSRCPLLSLRKKVRGAAVLGREYSAALTAGRIGLGLLSPLVPDRSTTRSLEIPATGTFLLAERTEEHQELFKEGIEAEFFDSVEELIDKATYYLRHDQHRERIAAAGRERCLSSGYCNRNRMQEILDRLDGAKTWPACA